MNCLVFCYVNSIQSGATAVYAASNNCHTAVVQLLIENGADISICLEVQYVII